jgi:hypothetical protein
VPQQIDVRLWLGIPDQELALPGAVNVSELQASGRRLPLSTLLQLNAASASPLRRQESGGQGWSLCAPPTVRVEIPPLPAETGFEPMLCTTITVFGEHVLAEYESEITLPLRCPDLRSGATYLARYDLGSYPRFVLEESPSQALQ